jgi:CRP-like cAMP-binding protein
MEQFSFTIRDIPSGLHSLEDIRFGMGEPSGFTNAILKKLDLSTIGRLRLRQVDLACGQRVVPHGEDPCFALFLESGIASLTVLFRDGSQVEAGIIGSESMIGIDSLLGYRHRAHGTFMQLAGTGFSCCLEEARQEFARFGAFHNMILGCMQVSHSQAIQLAACNTRHEVIQRIPRWLLMCSDRLLDSEIPITHEMICNALGVSRSTVTMALDKLQKMGAIDCRRGRIRILAIAALRSITCECYSLMAGKKPEPLRNSGLKPAEPMPFVIEMPINAVVA